jgi:hypothetical protein
MVAAVVVVVMLAVAVLTVVVVTKASALTHRSGSLEDPRAKRPHLANTLALVCPFAC